MHKVTVRQGEMRNSNPDPLDPHLPLQACSTGKFSEPEKVRVRVSLPWV